MGEGQEKEALDICDAYIAGATKRWYDCYGWPLVCAKREELLARLAAKLVPDMSGLRLIMEAESLLGPNQREPAGMRMTAAAGKLWFVPLSKYGEGDCMMYDPGRNEISRLKRSRNPNCVAATADTVFFGGYAGLDKFDADGNLLKHYTDKDASFPGAEVADLCEGGGKIYAAFRGPPYPGVAVLDPATDSISVIAPSSREAKREQEPIERMRRLRWDAITPRLYASAYAQDYQNRRWSLKELYGWSPQDKTWQRYPVKDAPQIVVSDGNETLEVRFAGDQSMFHFVKPDQTVTAVVPVPTMIGDPAWDQERIWVPTASGLYEVDRATGEVKWLAYQDGDQFLSVLKADGRLYVATSRALYYLGDPLPGGNMPATLVDLKAKAAPEPPKTAAAEAEPAKTVAKEPAPAGSDPQAKQNGGGTATQASSQPGSPTASPAATTAHASWYTPARAGKN